MKNEDRPGILLIGEETACAPLADAFAREGLRNTRTDTGLLEFTGCYPSYKTRIAREAEEARLRVRGAVAVQTPALEPRLEALGLEPGEDVVSLSAFREVLARLAPAGPGHAPPPLVVFALGLFGESDTGALRQVLEATVPLRDDLGYRVFVLYGNLKVGGSGLEAGVLEARRKGVVFLRFTSDRPVFSREPEGRVIVECLDETSRVRLTLHPEWTVVDESRHPGSRDFTRAGLLRADPGPDGFLPSDNVHRLGLETNRRGILGIRPGADPLGRDTLEDDIAAALLEMRALESIDSDLPRTAAAIDPGLCARCLTCFRSCPHGAVAVGGRVEIVPEACLACGVCEGACPAKAIRFFHWKRPAGEPEAAPQASLSDVSPGGVVVFACRRSADRARALCEHLGRELPADLNFVPVDCAGHVSRQRLMDALLTDASGVLVLACHTGNCHAERGNSEARSRVREVRAFLEEAGMDPNRVRFHTLAANMGVEFGRVVREFQEALEEMR